MPLGTALSFLYHKVLRFFRMSDSVKYCELPLYPTSIEEFYLHLQTHYTLGGSDRMNWFTVLEVRRYKKQALPQHEYVSVKVRGPNGQSYLCFERLRGKVVDKVDHNQVSIDKQLDSGSESTSLSSSPSLPRTPSQTAVDKPKMKMKLGSSSTIDSLNSLVHLRDARDRVTVLPTEFYEKTDEVDRTLLFHNSPFPLYELVVLAHTIHETRNTYLPFSDNCYFYAAAIVKALQQVYNQAVVVETTRSNDEKGLNSKKRKHTSAGSWSSIEVYGDEELDIQSLINRFQKDKEIFKRPVQEYEDKQRATEEGKRAAEAREAREIKARRAAEEGKRTAEAREARETEARRAAEAEVARLKFQLEQLRMAKQQGSSSSS